MRRFALVCWLMVWPCFALAQFKSQTGTVDVASSLRDPFRIGKTAVGLLGLDPSRLNISHSYQMGYISAGGQSVTQGLYLNTLSYQFKIPLTVALQWGIAHQPNFGLNDSSMLQNGPFVSGAQIRYQPSRHFLIQFDYLNLPFSAYHYGRYRGGWW